MRRAFLQAPGRLYVLNEPTHLQQPNPSEVLNFPTYKMVEGFRLLQTIALVIEMLVMERWESGESGILG